MSFIKLMAKNPFRNKARLALAVIGIAIGIATIVALGMVTDGLKVSIEEQLKTGGADFVVIKNTTSDSSTGSYSIKNSRVDEISKMDGVKQAAGVYTSSRMVEGNQLGLAGIYQKDLNMLGVKMIQGNPFSDDKNEVILGKLASEKMKKKVGDTITVNGGKYTITGIYETGNKELDSIGGLSLGKLQSLDENEGKVDMIYVKINNNADLKTVSQGVVKTYPGELTTISSLEDFQRADDSLQMVETASMAISLLAIVIGGIGIINTMIMSVFERTREIGVLKAVGWKSRRILSMILGESVVLTILAGLVGIILGVIGIEAIITFSDTPFQLIFTPALALRALGIAIFVGVIGGLYPAIRASRLPPTEALRYE
ncbi:ABC transporter permease [Methanobacterium subterraneum]|uniref:ABC transporter permease n=1 Tax=Methanobacterium subterraneum TaxID=59277 RepID=A0A7K4DLM8_9EURY|nr:ABC transporter permease [Methanobacterium subterraneum]MBW4256128.1 ABC transporter permease [Methanobacterium sp. YSL]NMO09300.1 ABC transporter permease [Methanobacterium subterraneum]